MPCCRRIYNFGLTSEKCEIISLLVENEKVLLRIAIIIIIIIIIIITKAKSRSTP